jgi:hypothetical protein
MRYHHRMPDNLKRVAVVVTGFRPERILEVEAAMYSGLDIIETKLEEFETEIIDGELQLTLRTNQEVLYSKQWHTLREADLRERIAKANGRPCECHIEVDLDN